MAPVSLKAMRYYVTALRHGNITRAAAELNVAASAVAAAIDQIEAQFQLTLATRHRSRGINPTASGKVMQRKFIRLLEEFDSVIAEGVQLKEALSGTLRIGYYAPVAPSFLPTILSGLLGQNSQTMLILTECYNEQAQSGLLSGDFDAILFASDAARSLVSFDPLLDLPPYCLAPAGHRFAAAGSVNLAEVANEPYVALNLPIVDEYYRRLFDNAGIDPSPVAYASSTEMVRSLVGAGHGCSILSMLPLTDVSYAGNEVVAVPVRDPLPALQLSVGYDKSNPRRIVTHFANRCRDYFSAEAGLRHVVQP